MDGNLDDERRTGAVTRGARAATRGRCGSFLAWFVFALGALGVLAAVGLVSLEQYAVYAFLWLLVSSEVYAPPDPGSAWWRRLQWVKAGGWVVLAYVVFERLAAVFL